MFNMLLLLFLTTLLPYGTYSLEAYDCASHPHDVMDIDLLDVSPCPDPSLTYLSPDNVRIQLVQTIQKLHVTTYRCEAVETITNTKCGFDSITYASFVAKKDSPINISPGECRSIVEHKKFLYRGVYYNMDRSSSFSVDVDIHGSRFASGSCSGASFEFRGETLYGYIQTAAVSLRVYNETAIWTPSLDELFLFNGQKVRYSSLSFQDPLDGSTYWNREDVNCENHLNTKYIGPASKYVPKINASGNILLLLNDPSKSKSGGLVQKEPKGICGRHGFATQIPFIYILYLQEHDEPISGNIGGASNVDELANIFAMIGHEQISSGLKQEETFSLLAGSICENQRKILKNQLSMLWYHDDPFIIKEFGSTGYAVMRQGAVAYLSPCTKVNVTYRDSSIDTHDIPVLYEGIPMYVNPRTLIIQKNSTTSASGPTIPVKWKLGPRWYCKYGQRIRCPAPAQLKPESMFPTSDLFDFTHIGQGIESRDEIESFREAFYHGQEKAAMIDSFADNQVRGTSCPGSITSSMEQDEIESLSHKVWSMISWLPLSIGTIWIWLMGVGVIGSFVFWIIMTCIRCHFRKARNLDHMPIWATTLSSLFSLFSYPIRKTTETALHAMESFSSPLVPPPGHSGPSQERRNTRKKLKMNTNESPSERDISRETQQSLRDLEGDIQSFHD